ncbi:DMT family transporter [Bacillus marinisedimentorum]|uniref:DMT family transporter n=1 Tax=Bacillus marinisedimentorum TaxID=1821260 RepID=UPI00087243E8|nr:EamA family transporter [Bacillus marinisedimentorum]
MNQRAAYLLIVLGAALWGIIGLFIDALYEFGFSPLQAVALRAVSASLLLLIYIGAKNPALLKIKLIDLPYFFGTGIVSIVLFNWAYFTAIGEISLSLAAALLYTGPAFVTIMARMFFKEPLSPIKTAALLLTLFGCASTVGVFPALDFSISAAGFWIGLASGFFYALYSIFGKVLSRSYSSYTITLYTFILASMALLFTSGLEDQKTLLLDPHVLFYVAGLGLIPTVLAYIFYTYGLGKVEASKASILTAVEPAIAVLIGVFVFGDRLGSWQIIGILSIILSVVLINVKRKQPLSSGNNPGSV